MVLKDAIYLFKGVEKSASACLTNKINVLTYSFVTFVILAA